MHRLLLIPSVLALLGAAAPAPSTVKEVMRDMVNPAAELYWKAGGEVDTAEGAQTRAPGAGDEARWRETVQAAETLERAGPALMRPAIARDSGKWATFSKQLAAAAAQAVVAAKARDEAKVFEAGSALYDACYACHAAYIPRPANSLYRQRTPDDAFKPPG